MLGRARMFYEAGYSIVMIDLQAHGESPGEQITLGHLERLDVQAAVEFARKAHPGEPIAVVGVSLGGASAVLASPLGIDALVLESVFPRVRDAVHNRVRLQLGLFSWVPAELLLGQLGPRLGVSGPELRPIDHLAQVGCPVLLATGSQDRHTTVAETREMFSAAREPKELWIVDQAGHVNLLDASPLEYRSRVLGFLERSMRKVPEAN